jgi:sugar phosphate isomerase/epimerase
MIPIGNMLWRIGERLDFDQQLTWTREAGFDGVGFHASAGVPGKWTGVEPSACDTEERVRLRGEIGRLSFSEIHAPFAINLTTDALAEGLAALKPVLKLAEDLAVDVVTVHAELPPADGGSGPEVWQVPMQDLDKAAAEARTRIVLEIVDGFDTVMAWDLPNVRINLDVGHMYLPPNRHVLERYDGIGDLIRHLGSTLAHLHIHDVSADGDVDHIEAGTGIVDFDGVASALTDIGYRDSVTLEMNPERVSPDGIRRSGEHLRSCFRNAGVL